MDLAVEHVGAGALAVASALGLVAARENSRLLEFFDSGRGAGAGHAISGVHHAVHGRHRAGELLRAQAMGQIEFDGDHGAGRRAGGDVALIAVALLADGLGVRVRAHSVTTIDQRSGEAACWARLSYYAGLAPGDGLKFSEGTAVLPLEAQPESSAEKRSLRIVEWRRSNASDQASPLEQRLADGWLPARTPTQFVTSRIGKTKAMLEVKAAEAGQSPQIVNQLGARIKQLVLVDENGGCFVGADLAPDASIALTRAASQHEAFGPISALLTASQPEVPPGMAYSSGDRSFFGLGGRYRYRYPYRYGPAYPRQSGADRAAGRIAKHERAGTNDSRNGRAT